MDIEARRTGLGGSDMGAILGMNPWRTPFQVWQEKTGREIQHVDVLQTRFGTYAEEFVAQEYSRETGRRVQRFTSTLRHPEAPVLGNVDRLVIPDGAKVAAHRGQIRTDLGLECKTASAFAAGKSGQWGESGTDQIPESYLIQCATYQALTGCAQWDLAVMFGNHDFRVYHIERDMELEEMILARATEWWERHVIQDIPPDPTNEAEARQRWAMHRKGNAVDLTRYQAASIQALRDLKRQIADLERQAQSIRDTLIPLIGDAEEVTHAGNLLATYRANKPSLKTDWRAVATALGAGPELVAMHTTETPGARVLRLIDREEQ